MLSISTKSTEDYVVLLADRFCRVMSSAVLNGGYSITRSFLNLRVDKKATTLLPQPIETLSHKARDLDLPMACTGMMTAASMASLVHHRMEQSQLSVECWVTCGLDNLRRCGDEADELSTAGTINIIVSIDRRLSDAAMAEALMLVTEARTTAVMETGLISPVSGLPAGGTGTDSHAVFCPLEDEKGGAILVYCGKHTKAGELIAQVVFKCVSESIQRCLDADMGRRLLKPANPVLNT